MLIIITDREEGAGVHSAEGVTIAQQGHAEDQQGVREEAYSRESQQSNQGRRDVLQDVPFAQGPETRDASQREHATADLEKPAEAVV